MKRIYELLEKQFLSDDEINELVDEITFSDVSIRYEYCGKSQRYRGYRWAEIIISKETYNVYFK